MEYFHAKVASMSGAPVFSSSESNDSAVHDSASNQLLDPGEQRSLRGKAFSDEPLVMFSLAAVGMLVGIHRRSHARVAQEFPLTKQTRLAVRL